MQYVNLYEAEIHSLPLKERGELVGKAFSSEDMATGSNVVLCSARLIRHVSSLQRQRRPALPASFVVPQGHNNKGSGADLLFILPLRKTVSPALPGAQEEFDLIRVKDRTAIDDSGK